MDRGVESY